MPTKRIDLTVRPDDRGGTLPLASLVRYLHLFNTAYVMAGELGELDAMRRVYRGLRPEILRLRQGRVPRREMEPIEIIRLSFESPLRVTLAGSIAALTLAVTLSGGKIEATPGGGFKAEVPPLGQGIERLEQALPTAKKAGRDVPPTEKKSTQRKSVKKHSKKAKQIARHRNT